MKRFVISCLIISSIAINASLVACLSSKTTSLPQMPITFTSTYPSVQQLSPTPTIIITPTWSGNYDNEIATVSVARTRAAKFPRICDSYYPGKYSPNGLWLVELCSSKEDKDLILTLSNSETQVLWKFRYQDHLPQMDFVPDGGMGVIHWSNDGRYAYFSSHLGGDGGECFYKGGDRGAGLFRVDLKTGESTAILPTNNDFWWYGFSFSPTDRRLVYGVQARDLKILDVTTGKFVSISSDDDAYETGGFLWSGDGLRLVYSALTRDSNGERENYSLRLVDVLSGNEQVLLEAPDECFDAVSWTENDILIIEKNYDQTVIQFDLNTNNIINENTTP